MRKTTRILALLLALLLALSMFFVACTQKQQEEKPVETNDKQTDATTTDEEKPADGTTGDETDAEPELTGLWKDATYTTDKTFGSGATEITLVVTAEDKSVTFTIKTDKETLSAALEEFGLIAKGSVGYYTIVNGMTADYDANQSYWAFYIGSDYATTGVDSTPVEAGASYALVYTIGF